MNHSMKCALFLLGGIGLGVAGAMLIKHDKLNIKPFATDILSHGLDIKDVIVFKAEVVKGDVDEMIAGAKDIAKNRKQQVEAES